MRRPHAVTRAILESADLGCLAGYWSAAEMSNVPCTIDAAFRSWPYYYCSAASRLSWELSKARHGKHVRAGEASVSSSVHACEANSQPENGARLLVGRVLVAVRLAPFSSCTRATCAEQTCDSYVQSLSTKFSLHPIRLPCMTYELFTASMPVLVLYYYHQKSSIARQHSYYLLCVIMQVEKAQDDVTLEQFVFSILDPLLYY